MAYSKGILWTRERIERLRDLVLEGETGREISDILSYEWKIPIGVQAVNNAKIRYKLTYYIEKESDVKLYKHKKIPLDNYIVSCDYHAPYYSTLWFNRLLAIAQRFNIRKHIIAGDLFDLNFAKAHKIIDGEEKTGIDQEIEGTDPVMQALKWFDEIFLISGNHESRLGRITDARIQSRHVVYLYGKDLGNKLKFSEYDSIQVGSHWRIIHPKSYSQISGSTAIRLVEKYRMNVLNAHGHFVALRYDRSGQNIGVDLGGILDRDKIAYCNLATTTHPAWNNGFGMILNDKFYHFHAETDWDYWLK
jgi:hypothetical protein